MTVCVCVCFAQRKALREMSLSCTQAVITPLTFRQRDGGTPDTNEDVGGGLGPCEDLSLLMVWYLSRDRR